MTAAERSHAWDPTTLQAAVLNDVTLGSGFRLAFRELGEGPPVLLLHGWPTSSCLWRGVMPALVRTHRVLAPDLPGFGASDTDVRYDFTFFDAVPPDDISVGRHGPATGSAVSSGASLPACMPRKGHLSEAAGT